jgi:predicted aminopeptidase
MYRHFYLPFPLALVLIIGGAALCSGCYTLKQGTTMLGYLNRAIPLENLVDTGSEEDRRFAMQVMDIRRFAMEELGLRQSKNYTRYVELDRNYLAAVVSACAKDSFTRHEWWFPVVGRMPYKGFFDIEDARKERVKLEKKDLDVWIRGVDAFSTLGWFKDPLYSYMKDYPLRDIADLIIHELFHATLFLKNHAQFNEEFASFVGTEGARLYMESIADSADAASDDAATDDAEADAVARRADRAAYLAFIQGLIAELDTVYKNSALSRDDKLEQKDLIIAQAKVRFEADYDTVFLTENYRSFIELPINNAYLELYRLYYEGNTWFKDLYEKSGSNLRTFIEAAKTLKGREDPKIELERALGF